LVGQGEKKHKVVEKPIMVCRMGTKKKENGGKSPRGKSGQPRVVQGRGERASERSTVTAGKNQAAKGG